MRKIEQEMLAAVKGKRDFIMENTAVCFVSASESGNLYGDRSEIHLHGNHIADYWHKDGLLEVDRRTLATWPTKTTCSRLRALGAKANIVKGVPHLGGKPVLL